MNSATKIVPTIARSTRDSSRPPVTKLRISAAKATVHTDANRVPSVSARAASIWLVSG